MKIKYLFIIGTCLILFCIGAYFFVFHEGLSHHSGDWGNFGGYVGGVSALIISSLVAYLAWYTFGKNKETQINQEIFASIAKSVEKLNDLRYELNKLTEHNGFSKSEQERIKSNISVECDFILSRMKFVNLQSSDLFVKSVASFKEHGIDDNYNSIVMYFSKLIEDNIKSQLNKGSIKDDK